MVNARDAMPLGGTVVIGAKESRLNDAPMMGRYVCLSVTDSGEGMDAETLARATEPFFTTKGVGKGTGLGLPMVHGVAQQSEEGTADIEKREGGGEPPRKFGCPVHPRSRPSRQPPPVPKPAASGGARVVMLVDDDALVLHSAAAPCSKISAIESLRQARASDRR